MKMRRAAITIADDLEAPLNAWMRQQEAMPTLSVVVQAALREYLAVRGVAGSPKRLKITPCRKGSGVRYVSVHHDRYLAGR